jgi:4-methyl-5(b-hydroxyethyl)-thiazole monophosphate biosynthesis
MKSVLVLFAEGSEELETITVVNILRRGGISVSLAGTRSGVLRGSRGIMLQPDTTLEAVLEQDFDMLVLPGGQPGTHHFLADKRVAQLAKDMVAQDKYVTAICAAPAVLAQAGLLNSKRATSFPGCLDDYPQVLQQTAAVVADGKIITSRGPGTAMDFALVLLECLSDATTRQTVEAGLVRAA